MDNLSRVPHVHSPLMYVFEGELIRIRKYMKENIRYVKQYLQCYGEIYGLYTHSHGAVVHVATLKCLTTRQLEDALSCMLEATRNEYSLSLIGGWFTAQNSSIAVLELLQKKAKTLNENESYFCLVVKELPAKFDYERIHEHIVAFLLVKENVYKMDMRIMQRESPFRLDTDFPANLPSVEYIEQNNVANVEVWSQELNDLPPHKSLKSDSRDPSEGNNRASLNEIHDEVCQYTRAGNNTRENSDECLSAGNSTPEAGAPSSGKPSDHTENELTALPHESESNECECTRTENRRGANDDVLKCELVSQAKNADHLQANFAVTEKNSGGSVENGEQEEEDGGVCNGGYVCCGDREVCVDIKETDFHNAKQREAALEHSAPDKIVALRNEQNKENTSREREGTNMAEDVRLENEESSSREKSETQSRGMEDLSRLPHVHIPLMYVFKGELIRIGKYMKENVRDVKYLQFHGEIYGLYTHSHGAVVHITTFKYLTPRQLEDALSYRLEATRNEYSLSLIGGWFTAQNSSIAVLELLRKKAKTLNENESYFCLVVKELPSELDYERIHEHIAAFLLLKENVYKMDMRIMQRESPVRLDTNFPASLPPVKYVEQINDANVEKWERKVEYFPPQDSLKPDSRDPSDDNESASPNELRNNECQDTRVEISTECLSAGNSISEAELSGSGKPSDRTENEFPALLNESEESEGIHAENDREESDGVSKSESDSQAKNGDHLEAISAVAKKNNDTLVKDGELEEDDGGDVCGANIGGDKVGGGDHGVNGGGDGVSDDGVNGSGDDGVNDVCGDNVNGGDDDIVNGDDGVNGGGDGVNGGCDDGLNGVNGDGVNDGVGDVCGDSVNGGGDGVNGGSGDGANGHGDGVDGDGVNACGGDSDVCCDGVNVGGDGVNGSGVNYGGDNDDGGDSGGSYVDGGVCGNGDHSDVCDNDNEVKHKESLSCEENSVNTVESEMSKNEEENKDGLTPVDN